MSAAILETVRATRESVIESRREELLQQIEAVRDNLESNEQPVEFHDRLWTIEADMSAIEKRYQALMAAADTLRHKSPGSVIRNKSDADRKEKLASAICLEAFTRFSLRIAELLMATTPLPD